MPRVIPEEVTHEEFMEAIKPLLDLLQVTAHEIMNDIHIGHGGGEALSMISFSLVPHVGEPEGEYPEGHPAVLKGVDLDPVPPQWSEWAIPVSVKVGPV